VEVRRSRRTAGTAGMGSVGVRAVSKPVTGYIRLALDECSHIEAGEQAVGAVRSSSRCAVSYDQQQRGNDSAKLVTLD
jgi:hypothetical protein